MSEVSRDTVIRAAKRAAQEAGSGLSRPKFEQQTGISQYHIYKLFPGGWSEVKQLAGLNPHPMDQQALPDEELLAEFHRVTTALGDIPTWARFSEHARMSADVIRRRFGGTQGTLNRYHRRSPKFLAKPAVRIEAMCLPSQLDLRATRCGGLWHRRCRRAGPGPGGTQDEGQEQQLESDGEAIEVGPGLPDRVVHRDGDVQRCHDEVRGAVDTGGQRRGEQDHEDRDRYEREPDDDKGLADVELEDDAGQDVVDDAGLVQEEVVDVDVEEHEARPGGRELRSDRYRRIVQCCRGLGVCAQGSL